VEGGLILERRWQPQRGPVTRAVISKQQSIKALENLDPARPS
jgi:hypothetical protein